MNIFQLDDFLSNLQQPRFCIGPPLDIILGDTININTSKQPIRTKTFKDCLGSPRIVILLNIIEKGNSFINFLLIDTQTKVCERINPYYPQFMDYGIDSAIQDKFKKVFPFTNYLTPIDHCPLIDDCYFSTLYYFETRIINPQLTPDEVLSLLSSILILEFNQVVGEYKNKLRNL